MIYLNVTEIELHINKEVMHKYHECQDAIADMNDQIDHLVKCTMAYINKGDPKSMAELRIAIDIMVELQNTVFHPDEFVIGRGEEKSSPAIEHTGNTG